MRVSDISNHAACAFSAYFFSLIAASLANKFLAGVAFHLLPSPPITFYTSIFVSFDLAFRRPMLVWFPHSGVCCHICLFKLGLTISRTAVIQLLKFTVGRRKPQMRPRREEEGGPVRWKGSREGGSGGGIY